MNIYEKLAKCCSADEVQRMLKGTSHVVVSSELIDLHQETAHELFNLKAEDGLIVELKSEIDEQLTRIEGLVQEIERLRVALHAAGKSLHVIGDDACIKGNGGMLEHGDQVRGFARNRGTVALAALNPSADDIGKCPDCSGIGIKTEFQYGNGCPDIIDDPNCPTCKGTGEPSSSDMPEIEMDLNTCPQCGGPADNGHDRCIPPSPYWCSKCNPAAIADSCWHEGCDKPPVVLKANGNWCAEHELSVSDSTKEGE